MLDRADDILTAQFGITARNDSGASDYRLAGADARVDFNPIDPRTNAIARLAWLDYLPAAKAAFTMMVASRIIFPLLNITTRISR